MTHRTAGPISYSSWTEKALTLLPITDYVVLGRHGVREALFVPWDAIRSLAPGSLTEEEQCDPPRYRTTKWPDAGAMKELVARALPF